MVNRVVLVGRLVKDPELRKTNSDVSFATFTLAVDNRIREQDGTRGTIFIDCRVFRDQAENLVKPGGLSPHIPIRPVSYTQRG